MKGSRIGTRTKTRRRRIDSDSQDEFKYFPQFIKIQCSVKISYNVK